MNIFTQFYQHLRIQQILSFFTSADKKRFDIIPFFKEDFVYSSLHAIKVNLKGKNVDMHLLRAVINHKIVKTLNQYKISSPKNINIVNSINIITYKDYISKVNNNNKKEDIEKLKTLGAYDVSAVASSDISAKAIASTSKENDTIVAENNEISTGSLNTDIAPPAESSAIPDINTNLNNMQMDYSTSENISNLDNLNEKEPTPNVPPISQSDDYNAQLAANLKTDIQQTFGAEDVVNPVNQSTNEDMGQSDLIKREINESDALNNTSNKKPRLEDSSDGKREENELPKGGYNLRNTPK